MAVFTELTAHDLDVLLRDYDIGDFSSLSPISAGIENTNYFVETRSSSGSLRRWVLTIFENLSLHELPYFCELTAHLAQDGFAVPAPVLMRSEKAIFEFGEKRGVIVPCLSGEARRFPSILDCAALGAWMARMHVSLQGFKEKRPNIRNLSWMQAHAARLAPVMDAQEYAELIQAIQRFQDQQPLLAKCPQGTVHGDFFHDNVLFEGNQISGVIDFYNASEAPLLYDLAVAANDWSIDKDGQRDQAKLKALVDAYRESRGWTADEELAWPYFLELAALSFWVSRLSSFHTVTYQKTGLVSGDVLKDPNEMRNIMRLSMKPIAND